ncbi:MAG: hypothetical protein IK096_00930, partial [Lachnospiraceae bacterium]|nr:hypothetical protein [Lachnospiraceae bacterium]
IVDPEYAPFSDTLKENLYNARLSRAHRQGQARPENRYLLDLFDTENGVRVSKEGRQQDIKRAAGTNPTLGADYVRNLSQMMRRMDEMQLLKPGSRAEEANKIYGFHQVIEAKKRLRDALQADMSVAENRQALSQAVEDLKAKQAGMDELIRMAKDHFSASEYMDNLDAIRNSAMPWQYARDMVSTSQVNAVWMFANLLKENQISFDEFEQHPDQVIEKLKTTALEQSSTLKAATKGHSMGEIAAFGACNYYDSMIIRGQRSSLGQYSRGIAGIIEADPEDDSASKERNRFLYKQNIMGYATDLGHNARENIKSLMNAFREPGGAGWEAVKTLTVIPEEDFDPDRMLTVIPINTDGSRREPFRLGDYLKEKGNIDYQAQAGRLEKMLADAAKTNARILEAAENMNASIRSNNYKPFPLVQARQQALSEMLLAHPENKDLPGYAELENEILNAAQRYEDLRRKDPSLNLPELTREQKKTLDRQKKQYLDLRNNRAKRMGKLEDRIYKAVKQEEKTFNSRM